MGRKDALISWKMFSPDPTDLSTDQTSQYTNIQFLDNVGITVLWTGTSPVGQITVQGSNDPNNGVTAPTNWVDLDFGSTINISGNSGGHLININQRSFGWIRMIYTAVSGTGTMSATLNATQL